jgi:hypothetical protein
MANLAHEVGLVNVVDGRIPGVVECGVEAMYPMPSDDPGWLLSAAKIVLWSGDGRESIPTVIVLGIDPPVMWSATTAPNFLYQAASVVINRVQWEIPGANSRHAGMWKVSSLLVRDDCHNTSVADCD